jgi:hypothetical protein
MKLNNTIYSLYNSKSENFALEEFRQKKSYVLPGFSTRILLEEQQAKIFFQEGISHSVRFWGQYSITHSDLLITTLPAFHDEKRFSEIAEVIVHTQRMGVNALDQFLICCNSNSEVVDARNAGFKNSFLIHHNSFLDEKLYHRSEDLSLNKIFYMVMNTRPEAWKRPFFAAGIRNLAIIKGANYQPHNYYDLKSLNPAYINDERISPEEVVSILNRSYCGGIFSEKEGGNYSSGEYLLCGIPVVSTPSKGGRNEYFNEFNHFLVYEPSDTKFAVTSLINQTLATPAYGESIRAATLKRSHEFLKKLFTQVNSFLSKCNVDINFEKVYPMIYKNKMTEYTRLTP